MLTALRRRAAGREGVCLAVLLSGATFSPGEEGRPEPTQAAASQPETGQILHLEGRFGSPDALWGEAGYKVERGKGGLTKELELKVHGARPGVSHALTVDGFALARIVTDPKGAAKFELVEDGKNLFPEGFPEPKAGSVVRVGDLMELRLEPLEKLTDLESAVEGTGRVSGKATFRVERLGKAVTREFRLKLSGAQPKAVLPVALDGVAVGDLKVHAEGKGELKFSTKEGPPFPPNFPEPRAGSKIRIGDLFEGEFRVKLAHGN